MNSMETEHPNTEWMHDVIDILPSALLCSLLCSAICSHLNSRVIFLKILSGMVEYGAFSCLVDHAPP